MASNLEPLLIHSGVVTPEGLHAARADAARTRKRLPETLIDLGLVTERRFAEWVAQVSRTPLLDPLPADTAESVLQHVTRAIAREVQVVPLRLDGEQLFVAMVNPLDREAVQLLETVTRLSIRPVTGVRSDIERLVNRFYPEDFAAADITILPPVTANFELQEPARSAALSQDEAPFDFSNETLLRRPAGLDFLRDAAGSDAPAVDHEFGTLMASPLPSPAADQEFGTMMAAPARDLDTLPPPASAGASQPPETKAVGESTAPTNPFVAIERQLEQIVRMIGRIERRLDDLEARLARAESLSHD